MRLCAHAECTYSTRTVGFTRRCTLPRAGWHQPTDTPSRIAHAAVVGKGPAWRARHLAEEQTGEAPVMQHAMAMAGEACIEQHVYPHRCFKLVAQAALSTIIWRMPLLQLPRALQQSSVAPSCTHTVP